ncbi:MAG: Polymorphic rane protein Chlamydia [Bacteroidetes bacterium]|jgi:hypothetical protein|nr:Polymorphic rane protein Chlamydia [Bacteroidota bacterium]
MKKIISFLVLSIYTAPFYSQTVVNAGSVNGIWTESNSPYYIAGDVTVVNDSTLIIEPGVSVIFQGQYKISVLGRLIATGTVNDSIVFTANNISMGWSGIKFNNTLISNDSSLFKYCRIEYSKALGGSNSLGGAIYFNNYSKFEISNCLITHCYASQQGGAIFCDSDSSPTIIKNTFLDNSSGGAGAIACLQSNTNPLISGNLFINNTGGYFSGAVATRGTNTICNNIFYKNSTTSSTYAGGAIYCAIGADPFIFNNFFINNSALNSGGGAIYMYMASSTLYNNVFSNNAAKYGGAIYQLECGNFDNYYNNTFSNNNAVKGGAIFLKGEPQGSFGMNGSSPTIINSILWGNTASTSGNQIYLEDDVSNPDFMYCNIQGGSLMFGLNTNVVSNGLYTNNIDLNPNFVSPTTSPGLSSDALYVDLSLQPSSPCRNSGHPTGTYPSTDIIGNVRVQGQAIDMGAYESSIITDIESFDNQNVMIYPNPSNGRIIVNLGSLNRCVVEIFDSYGKLIFLKQFEGVGEADLSQNKDGLYFVKIKYGSAVYSKKLIISK